MGTKKMTVHELKTWRQYFQLIWERKKLFEIRNNDRNFAVGDVLDLREYDHINEKYTGRGIMGVKITCIVFDCGLKDGYVCLGLDL